MPEANKTGRASGEPEYDIERLERDISATEAEIHAEIVRVVAILDSAPWPDYKIAGSLFTISKVRGYNDDIDAYNHHYSVVWYNEEVFTAFKDGYGGGISGEIKHRGTWQQQFNQSLMNVMVERKQEEMATEERRKKAEWLVERAKELGLDPRRYKR